RRRGSQGAPPAGADGPRDAAASGPSAHHDGADRDGGGHRPAPARSLRPPRLHRGDDRPVGRPGARPARAGVVGRAPLERTERTGRGVSGLWDWSVRAWSAEGVAETCLHLQDAAGQCPPLLLWAAWTARTARAADDETLEAACDIARAWQDSAIEPLRALRR